MQAIALSGALLVGLVAAGSASAQDAAAADETTVEEIVVTGFRAALASALNQKRESNVMVDVINAEDIADFPDANLAESLQRLPGVSIDRENGEGNTISVRGLGGDFTRVRLNGLETLSTSGASSADGALRRDRGFQFNTFASELFSSLSVQKTASAEVDEGSLGATVDLTSGRPFNFNGRRVALAIQDGFYQNGGTHNPRFAGLVSDRWDTRFGEIGLLGSFAFNKRDQVIDSYARGIGSNEYTYRGATFNNANSTAALDPQGFALPSNVNAATVLNRVTNPEALGLLVGSNPAAYNLLQGGAGNNRGSLVTIPSLASLNHRELSQERLGTTIGLQWRPTPKTTVSVDYLYAQLDSQADNYQIGPVGLNRNNTNGNRNLTSFSYQTAPTASATNNSYNNRVGIYANCATQTATEFRGPIDCGQTLYGNTPVFTTAPGASGTVSADRASYNPNNLNVYDYYNQPGSVGYIPHPQYLAQRGAFIGRPSVRVIDAGLNDSGSSANYLVLGNVDMRSAVDRGAFTNYFSQGSIDVAHEFTDTLRLHVLYGESRSVSKNTGLLADFIRLDSGQGVAGNNYFVFDGRDGGTMPKLDFGFDVANPASWDFVKGYSALRHYQTVTDNHYQGGRFELAWDFNDNFTFKFGAGQRKFDFFYTRYERLIGDTQNPSLLEGVRSGLVPATSVANMGKTVSFGEGLDVPEGTPTSFFVPTIEAFQQRFGFDCNCINQFGDWRLSDLRNGGVNTFWVDETDTGFFGQVDYNLDIFGRTLRGNIGVRQAKTEIESRGRTPSGRPIADSHSYDDTLPSFNAAYEVTDELILRFGAAKVMARPQLVALSPGISNLTVPAGAGNAPADFDGSNAAITVGNVRLKPFRATNFDFSAEWYFARDAVLSGAVFVKEIDSFPQIVLREGALSDIFSAEAIASILATYDGLTDSASISRRAYIAEDRPFQLRQYNDAPGGTLKGIEINYQQNLTFLPEVFQFLPEWTGNFGILANYTHIESELTYILDPARDLTGSAPFLGASPDAFNFTFFYETEKFQGRLTSAYRAEYQTTYPLASGGCDPGACDSPLINDFIGSGSTFNLDASFTYKWNDAITFTLEALNLTNQTDERWAYQDDPVVSQYGSTGRQFFFGARFRY
jgi:TonB-dependent receptor